MMIHRGLKEFQLEVGHADLFRGLVEEAGISQSEAQELRELIVSKNFFGAQEFVGRLEVADSLKEIFEKLPELLGDLTECVQFVKERTKNERVLQALERLQKVEEILGCYGCLDYVTVDFSMLSQYSYYTGVIFRAYTYGNGEALATGGRYDGLVQQFGKKASAIGLAIVIDQLMLALTRQNLFEDTTLGGGILLYPQSLRKEAIGLAQKYRKEGRCIQMLRKVSAKSVEEYLEYAKRADVEELIYLEAANKVETYTIKGNK